MNVKKFGYYLLTFLVLMNVLVAMGDDSSDEATRIHEAICSMVTIVKSAMGAVFLILIVLAAIVYAGGQILGAETRARANVWATSMFVGAIIGGLIYLVVPVFLTYLLGEEITEACEDFEFD